MSVNLSTVNTTLAPDPPNRHGESTTPTTPRPSTAPNLPSPHMNRMEDSTTPTRANFSSMSKQQPLPTEAFPATITVPESVESDRKSMSRGDSSVSGKSRSTDDMDMDNSDAGSDAAGSDDDSVDQDGSRPSKKKKSQRFYCTDYPPCSLSFTRSEHLARHIRKHTGERPFQCHCSRRFSRLDNLRQHAQTVHVNEEIPGDSLAATGARFQRQVRTERVRTPGSRSRASTAGSQTPARGHHRNSLSASSITSVGSSYSPASEARRRPAPLMMAADSRVRYSGEMFPPESPTGQFQYYRPQSPGHSPASATFSNQNSPRWNSTAPSPAMSFSRGHSQTIYGTGSRTPGRRLSVPSSGNPFQSPHGSVHPPVLSSLAGTFSAASNTMGSPTSTTGSLWSRRDSIDDPDWRRRTWHPDSGGFTSRLNQVNLAQNFYANGPPPKPATIVPSNGPPYPPVRLPGIESFDPLRRPTTPPRRGPTPMMIDTPTRPQMSRPDSRERPTSSWEAGVNGMHRLDIAHHTPPSDNAGSWASDTQRAVQAQAENIRMTPPSVRFEQSNFARPATRPFHQHTSSAPIINTHEARRAAWYGPGAAATEQVPRTSPDSNSSEGGIPGTPGSAAQVESNPAILHSNGYIESRQADPRLNPQNVFMHYQGPTAQNFSYPRVQPQTPISPHTQQLPKQADSNMSKLDALVAVATSEENVAAAY